MKYIKYEKIILSLGMITLHKSCNMLRFNLCGIKHAVPNARMHVKTDGRIILKCIFQFLPHPSHLPRHNGQYNICIFNQEIQVFGVYIFVLSSNLVLATERTKSMGRFALKSVDFGQFMSSEDTETLILALSSKTGQSDTEYFIWNFLSENANGYI